MKLVENKEEKKKRKKGRLSPLNRIRRFGMIAGGGAQPYRPTLNPRNLSYEKSSSRQSSPPREERAHWDGRVHVWTEPQKPRQEKVVKYEVNTEKLLNDLERNNEDLLNKAAKQIEDAIEQAKNVEAILASEKSDDEPKTSEPDSETNLQKVSENDKETMPSSDVGMDESELENLLNELKNGEAAIEPDKETVESQEAEHEEHAETNTNEVEPTPTEAEQSDILDDPELILMSPSFWEELEDSLEDAEQVEPEEIEYIPEGE